MSLLGVPWEGTEEQRGPRERTVHRWRGLLTLVGRAIRDATSVLRTTPGESSSYGSSGSEADPASVGVTRDKGKMPQQHRKLKLHRWQTLLAAIIAAIATIVVALITAHGRPTSGGPSRPPARLWPTVSIASFSETPLPPPPGESISFYGTVDYYGITGGDGAKIYVIVRRVSVTSSSVGTRPWLVSPPAHVVDGGKWSVKWDLSNPPANAQWTAVLMINDLATLHGACYNTKRHKVVPCPGVSPPPPSFHSQLHKSGPSAPEAWVKSEPVRVP